MPRTAGSEEGSGRWSMAENRNASAQSWKDETREGESPVGGSSAMTEAYAPPLTASVTPGRLNQ